MKKEFNIIAKLVEKNSKVLDVGCGDGELMKYINENITNDIRGLEILKSNFPNLPIICDPSHICGNRKMIFDISQKALDLDYDGLIIESHIDPDNAWSDSKQQITPEALKKTLKIDPALYH